MPPRLPLRTLPRLSRFYATVREDLTLYDFPRPPQAIRSRPPPRHRLPTTYRPPAETEALFEATARRRRKFVAASFTFTAVAVGGILLIKNNIHHTESPPRVLNDQDSEPVELVDSGTTSVPAFPRTLRLGDGKYELIGLGIRTVSFLGIQVYVVGWYVHADNVAALQKAVVKYVHPAATAVTNSERGELRETLLDAERSEKLWAEVLKGDVKFRSAFRIVPTRNTDFHHLRDGWVRGIQARSTKSSAYDDEDFVKALASFKAMFGGAGKVPKQKTLLLHRDVSGAFSVLYDPTGRNDGIFEGAEMGAISDPRISAALWLCYLAGKAPASEPARRSIVQGMLNKASRPAGTA